MTRFSSPAAHSREDILDELQRLQRALDQLKHDSLRGSHHGLDALRQRAESLWHNRHLGERYDDLAESTREAGRLARECARSHPLASAGMLVGVCALIGCYWLYRRQAY